MIASDWRIDSGRFMAVLLACGILVAGHPAGATLIVDDFSYTNGALLGKGGGDGWAGNWGASTGVGAITSRIIVTNDADLSYSGGGYDISQTGSAGRLFGNYSAFRGINRYIDTNLSGTVWFSMLVQNRLATDHAGIQFNNHADAPFGGSDYNVGLFHAEVFGTSVQVRYNATMYSNLATLTLNNTHLLLGRIDIGADNDRLQLWADPADLTSLGAALFDRSDANIGTELYLGGVFSYGAADGGVQGYVDALRISDGAQAFYEVTGIPEPGTALLAALGGLLLWRRRPVLR